MKNLVASVVLGLLMGLPARVHAEGDARFWWTSTINGVARTMTVTPPGKDFVMPVGLDNYSCTLSNKNYVGNGIQQSLTCSPSPYTTFVTVFVKCGGGTLLDDANVTLFNTQLQTSVSYDGHCKIN